MSYLVPPVLFQFVLLSGMMNFSVDRSPTHGSTFFTKYIQLVLDARSMCNPEAMAAVRVSLVMKDVDICFNFLIINSVRYHS